MRVLKKVKSLLNLRQDPLESALSLGFVPTMGALHQGHLSLIEKAKGIDQKVMVSIFVNPKQFNDADDFQKYPRTVEADLAKLEEVGVDYVFLPEVEEIFPEGYTAGIYDLGSLPRYMEGAYRPGHFEGVAAVLERFFHLVQPNHAYFGEKDFQQVRVVEEFIHQMNIDLELVRVPIKREPGGLAMSSRNERLSKQQKLESLIIYNSLCKARELLKSGETFSRTQEIIESDFQGSTLDLEYFCLCAEKDLIPASDMERGLKYRIFIAAFLGNVRLIDNMEI